MDKPTVEQKNIKQLHKLTVADLFTLLRIVGTLFLIFGNPSRMNYLIVYSACGLSDIVDGWIARATKTTSTFGARLDSIADLMFYCTMIITIFPVLLVKLSIYIWIAVATVVFLRVSIYVIVAFKFRCFSSTHSYLNKASGAMVFFTPFFLNTSWIALYCSLICVVGGLATIEELIMHLRAKEYDPSKKSIFISKLSSK